jgi:hypothetical protein
MARRNNVARGSEIPMVSLLLTYCIILLTIRKKKKDEIGVKQLKLVLEGHHVRNPDIDMLRG